MGPWSTIFHRQFDAHLRRLQHEFNLHRIKRKDNTASRCTIKYACIHQFGSRQLAVWCCELVAAFKAAEVAVVALANFVVVTKHTNAS